MSLESKLPLFEVEGNTPYELGYNYGVVLKDRIGSTVNVYYNWFIAIGANDVMLEQECNEYQTLMKKQCPDLCTEIKGISDGSQVPEWKIYLINCRTEIFNILLDKIDSEISPDTNLECSGILNVSNCVLAED